MATATMETRRVQYIGQVQGVAFRRRTEELAQHFPVSGYVRNLPDGSVELVATGDAHALTTFFARVASRMHREIVEAHATTLPTETFVGFVIRQ